MSYKEYNEWKCDLIWCPSQITKTVIIEDKEYNFYLRWRWDDPWYTYCNDIELNEEFSLYYSSNNYKKLLDWIDSNTENIIKFIKETK
jgi:hypothetical protein